MECLILRVGSDEPCYKTPTKNSKYCTMHNFLMKNSNEKPCLRCGKRTHSKLQICNACGAYKIRYHTVKYECQRLRQIDLS